MTPEQVAKVAVRKYGAVTDEELAKRLLEAKNARAVAQRSVAEIKHVIKYRKQARANLPSLT